MSEWVLRAACRGMPDHIFFPRDSDGPSYDAARMICSGCAVRPECLGLALANEMGERSDRVLRGTSRYGMFGGLDPHERARLQRSLQQANT